MQLPASVIPQIVRKELDAIEQQHKVTVLYACESGSRAWGVASSDSDFDVRFIYAYTPDDYLSIEDRLDQINLPLSDQLDISGWDIRKALRQFQGSNAALYEWLQSPQVYHEVNGFSSRLRELAPSYFSLRAGLHHYLGQARNIMKNELQGNQVSLQRYFYALRPVLAIRWILRRREVPPVAIAPLLELLAEEEQDVRQVVGELVARKAGAEESALVPPIRVLHDFIRAGIEEGLAKVPAVPVQRGDLEPLDQLFREVIVRAALLKNATS
jgi:predicted nucleotidyltransferase